MRAKPNVLVLKADGINRDEELAYAFELAGGNAEIVHVNDLRSKKENLKHYQILAVPGGFSYGDDIVSGKILATELASFFYDELRRFISRDNTLIIGICNGFQVLVRTGLLPFNQPGNMHTTLTTNDSGHFECRWVPLRVEQTSRCVFLNGMQGKTITYPVAHGEGKFYADKKTLQAVEEKQLAVFRYVDSSGNPTQQYPQNPNGALHAIAGICDISGKILGLMPHPECFIFKEQHPNWRRTTINKSHGLPLFENMISYVTNA